MKKTGRTSTYTIPRNGRASTQRFYVIYNPRGFCKERTPCSGQHYNVALLSIHGVGENWPRCPLVGIPISTFTVVQEAVPGTHDVLAIVFLLLQSGLFNSHFLGYKFILMTFK